MKAQKKRKKKREEETAGTFDVVSLDLAQKKRHGASEAEQEVPTGRVRSNQRKHKVVVSHGGILT